MFLSRSAVALARRTAIVPIAKRTITSTAVRRKHIRARPFTSSEHHTNASSSTGYARQGDPKPGTPDKTMIPFEEIKTEADLLPPGAAPGTVPTDLEQATGLERLEILGKMQGIDIFDMKPLDASRRGTLDNPIVVRSFGDEQYAGCTGYPADSHGVIWLTMSRDRPQERCPECGGVYVMEYVGPQDDPHAHHDHADGSHNYEEPKTFADFVRPEYR
ncbi:Cytochrome c oxidase subunit 4 [Acarospora aff. strigata]|nr:Cytochrome c oxidase subunit 4 [Acarospora aff. strigata]